MIESISTVAMAPTEQRILDSAQELLQSRGYNGFSYKDIAADVNIKTSSIHYHFGTKQALVESLFERYSRAYFAALDEITNHNENAISALQGFCHIFEQTARSGKFCMCGSLAAVHYAVPNTLNEKIARFTRKSEQWLEQVLKQGVENGELRLNTSIEAYAAVLFAALEGALMLCQTSDKGVDAFKATAEGLITAIKV